MKVEFVNSDHDGAALYIQASEFVKARNSDYEFTSLEMAVDGLSRLFNEEYHISSDEYDALYESLSKNEKVIIYPRVERRFTWLEMCVTKGNFIETIVEIDEYGKYRIHKSKKVTKQSSASDTKSRRGGKTNE